ncbi:reprolysin-like metallopeptidase [Lewinella sp. 4G2]|uniref:reprolysin-like metallopeptidase n=1 Tax=Lewinella sp. 4G2 TaxID=1803372 RepID=UPI0007B4BD61|nr:zinc-dependent metalloprotease family protein [Lewinella sp. 4G2]OAV43862.1 hypothetical protein A3850_004830 [Lewinella sp. 4G2]
MQRILLALALIASFAVNAQSSFQFTDVAANNAQAETKTVLLDMPALMQSFDRAPKEYSRQKSKVSVDLPLPDGTMLSYQVWDADLLPNDKTLGSYRVVNEYGTGRIATSPERISGVIQGPNGHYVIEAINAAEGLYAVYSYADFMEVAQENAGPLSCGFDDFAASPDYSGLELNEEGQNLRKEPLPAGLMGNLKAGNLPRELRVYDFIMTNTGEFAQKSDIGGTATGVRAAFNEATSALNSILEPQVGMKMNLIIVDGLIYVDPTTDPYTNANQGGELLSQVLPAFQLNNVGADTYDVGHLFTARCNDVGGVVSGAACTPGKTRGITCVSGTVLGAALGTMAHEVAHQFAVSHSWNNCPNSQNQRASNTSFEPGAGNSIMSYARACGNQNIGGRSPYYHVGSIEQFLNFTTVESGGGFACATVIPTDNFTPEVTLEMGDNLVIPISTPFRLEGSATDENEDDIIRYNWEQYDLGPASDIRNPTGTAPLFRSYPPSEEGNVRYLPALNNLVNGVRSNAEVLPTYERDITFRLTAHDYNDEAGGVDWETFVFSTDESAGPFVVNEPTEAAWRVGDYQEVTWDVAGTDGGRVNCKRVDIMLSLDGGQTFDLVLAEDAPNTGSAFVTVPEEARTGSARLMVKASENIFLNVNRQNFSVSQAIEPGYTLEPGIRYQEFCLPNTLSVEVSTTSILNFDELINLSIEDSSLPEGATVTFAETAIQPGTLTTLEVDFGTVNFTGIVPLTLIGVTESLDTARREILLDVVSNDFSDLVTVSPAEGTGGIVLGTNFDWTESANARDYQIQIATSPDFSQESIFAEATGLEETEFSPEDFFTENTLYFWRVRPRNRCGFGDWRTTSSFRTVNTSCNDYASDGRAIPLQGRGPSFKAESRLFVDDQNGVIGDVNIPLINVRYNFVAELNVRLISPAGTVVDLYKQNCPISTNAIILGFDDDAPDNITCPPDQAIVQQPVGSLADLVGERVFGDWILEVEVLETGGSAGAIEDWSIQFCTATTPEAPERIANNATLVPPLARNHILQADLEATSSEFGDRDVVYTLTELPEVGRLLLYGRELGLGDTWRQKDINVVGLKYEHLDDSKDEDFFGFVITTPNGGYLPIVDHDIIIDPDAVVVSNDDVSALEAGLEVFPNPVASELNVRWSAQVNRTIDVELFDLNGRRLQTRRVEGLTGATTINTSTLASGVYLLRVDGAVRRVVKQ